LKAKVNQNISEGEVSAAEIHERESPAGSDQRQPRGKFWFALLMRKGS